MINKKKWIVKAKNCPICRVKLNNNQIVKIKLIDTLVEYKTSINKNCKFYCTEHYKKNKYICFDCFRYYCCKCLIMNKHDQNHLIVDQFTQGEIDKYYEILFQINQPILIMKEYINNKYLSDIESKILELQKLKEEQITFFNKYINVLTHKFDTLINNELNQII